MKYNEKTDHQQQDLIKRPFVKIHINIPAKLKIYFHVSNTGIVFRTFYVIKI